MLDPFQTGLTIEEIVNTPSKECGIDGITEFKLRIYGCELIQKAGLMLRLPQVAMATAQVLFHRFYYRTSFTRHDVKNVAMGAVFLAAKVEETPKKLRDICNVFYRIQRRASQLPTQILDIYKEEYWELKNELIKTERYILKELGFMLLVIHPHKFILNYVKMLDGSAELSQIAWNYCNDSMRTNLCVRFAPGKIAVGCLYLAARTLSISLPETPNPWWELFDVTFPEVEEISRTILYLYKQPVAEYIDVIPKEPEVEEKVEPIIEEKKVPERRSRDRTPPRGSREKKRSRDRTPPRRDRDRNDRNYERDRDRGGHSRRDTRDNRDDRNYRRDRDRY